MSYTVSFTFDNAYGREYEMIVKSSIPSPLGKNGLGDGLSDPLTDGGPVHRLFRLPGDAPAGSTELPQFTAWPELRR